MGGFGSIGGSPSLVGLLLDSSSPPSAAERRRKGKEDAPALGAPPEGFAWPAAKHSCTGSQQKGCQRSEGSLPPLADAGQSAWQRRRYRGMPQRGDKAVVSTRPR
mmetsp:Transcript_38419/g.91132  ORF Transcript_38419/g.91132 Transcript_38419/m.91132 type:complete len:105 (-) Transcript_38419:466-780(-)